MRSLANKQPSNKNSAHQKPVRGTPTPVVRSRSLSTVSSGSTMLQRKPGCACGGGCPRCQEQGLLQTKLKISEPGDQYEQEADQIADEVMRMPEPSVQRQVEPEEEEEEGTLQTKPLVKQITPLVQRQTELIEEEEEETLQTKTPSGQTSTVSSSLQNRITALQGGGQPLPQSERAFFEPRFGTDFSQVRVHADSQAAETARAVNARAFTVGRDVVFGAGQYQPSASEGRLLLAHELTHVVQQRGSSSVIHRAALHTGRIYAHGSCYHLACRSTWAVQDDRYGYLCQSGTRHAGRKMRPLFTCDLNVAGTHANPCRENQLAMPRSRWRGFRGGQCGQDLVICANRRFTHGILRDISDRGFWEIGTRLMGDLGVTRGDIPDGAIYPDERDPQFRSDSRCR